MIPSYLLLSSTVLFGAHLFLLPLVKRRPIILNGMEAYCFILVLGSAIASLIHPQFYLLVAAAALIFFIVRPWVIYGASVEKVKDALHRAALATRTAAATTYAVSVIDDSLHLRIVAFSRRIIVLFPSSVRSSKKAALTMRVFRKFLLNYSIEL